MTHPLVESISAKGGSAGVRELIETERIAVTTESRGQLTMRLTIWLWIGYLRHLSLG